MLPVIYTLPTCPLLSESLFGSRPRGKKTLTFNLKGGFMDVKELKKILAGFCIAGLITGSAISLTGCDSAQSA
jgi:radical SAM modification target selenobiotic family peptide